MRTAFFRLAVVAALAAAPAARAQDAAPGALVDPRAPRFADVERGFFVGFAAGGPVLLLETAVKDPAKFPIPQGGGGRAWGHGVGLHLGYDLTRRLAVSLFADGYFLRAGSDYGAFDLMVGGLDVRWAFLGLKDRNGWERLQLFVHARGGAVLSHPAGLFADQDLLAGGGLGLEYFAQLRHFSWFVELDGLYVLSAGSAGGALLTGVRYSF